MGFIKVSKKLGGKKNYETSNFDYFALKDTKKRGVADFLGAKYIRRKEASKRNGCDSNIIHEVKSPSMSQPIETQIQGNLVLRF